MIVTNFNQPWSELDEALLGTLGDAALAARLGRTAKAVETKRRKMGIAPKTAHQRAWSAREARQLGKLSDLFVARRLGISRKAVRSERIRRGIGPASPRNVPRKYR
jgi:hypothetical protein